MDARGVDGARRGGELENRGLLHHPPSLSAALGRLRSLNNDAPLPPADYTPALPPHVLSDFDPSPVALFQRVPQSRSRPEQNLLD